MLWALLGLFDLILLTYQDFKNKMWVDDRLNYFMTGLSISLLETYPNSFLKIVILTVVTVALNIFIKKLKLLGEADANTISWLFWGLGFINIIALAYFMLWVAAFTVVQYIIKRLIIKANVRVPYYPVILVSFVIIVFSFGLF